MSVASTGIYGVVKRRRGEGYCTQELNAIEVPELGELYKDLLHAAWQGFGNMVRRLLKEWQGKVNGSTTL